LQTARLGGGRIGGDEREELAGDLGEDAGVPPGVGGDRPPSRCPAAERLPDQALAMPVPARVAGGGSERTEGEYLRVMASFSRREFRPPPPPRRGIHPQGREGSTLAHAS